MRNNWEEKDMSHTHHGQVDEKRLCDYGISTDRPISAPPPSGMGFNILDKLDEISSGAWREEDGSRFNHNGSKDLDFNSSLGSRSSNPLSNSSHANTFNGASAGDSIARPKSAAPQLMDNGLSIFQPDSEVPSSASLFEDFNIIKVGARRSASTGVIGHGSTKSSSVIESLGLIPARDMSAKKKPSFMDLIQEDFPRSPSLAEELTEKNVQASGNFSSHPQTQTQHSGSYHQSHFEHRNNTPVQHLQRDMHGHLQQNANNIGTNLGMGRQATLHENTRNVMYSQPEPRSQSFGAHAHSHVHQHPSAVQGHQNSYEQVPGNVYYPSSQRNGGQVAQPPAMHPHQAHIHPNSNAPHQPAMYVNSSYGGGYAVQYHQAPATSYPHGITSAVHSQHDPNMNPRIPHQQFLTNMPMQGNMAGQINHVPPPGTYIYFHPQAGAAPAPTHHQTVSIIDANGRPAAMAVPPSQFPNANRKQAKVVTMMGNNKVHEKNGRKMNRGGPSGKKGSSNSLDVSRHSISSSTMSLLEDYRSSKDRSWTASDVKGHIVEFCQDQNGSRFIQQRLELAKDAEKNLIIAEVLPSVHLLRNDVFGNYVVQKLFDHGSNEMRSKLKRSLMGEMLGLSTQMYGCRVVQKALERVDDDDLIELLAEFHDVVLTYIHDQNGNHVIQKIIEVVSNRSKTYQAEDKEKAVKFSKQLDFILNCIMANIVPLSCHPFGCRVLQRILEHCVESQKSLTLDAIQQCLRTLLDDQYGNYVIQHVLQFGRKSDRDIVLGIITENGMLELSRQKFASNVIEKLLKYGNSDHRNAVIREMLRTVEDKTAENGSCSVALLMVRDAYANYVVQTTLDVVAEGKERTLLLEELKRNSSQLRNYTFAKHIITKLEESDGRHVG
eukprot:CAMPEP_0194088042 /NCGR_PEP_ID=MMETSP0149-20130528/27571_1 /TAXON_ID=122233 /ORGANISM="Chaetoceros debilis, Strain MM31A-1" /LENGTH=887 /DNA_ID=CAMNT_0038771603 /DNA_START=247 /DNA_END=2910 /DNA_ORIENTATION=+